MHDAAGRAHHLPAKHLPDALVPHAHAKDREAQRPQLLNYLQRDARVLGPACRRGAGVGQAWLRALEQTKGAQRRAPLAANVDRLLSSAVLRSAVQRRCGYVARSRRRTWAGGDEDAARVHGPDLLHRLGVVWKDHKVAAQVAQVLAQVVGEAVVVVNHDDGPLRRPRRRRADGRGPPLRSSPRRRYRVRPLLPEKLLLPPLLLLDTMPLLVLLPVLLPPPADPQAQPCANKCRS